MHKKDTTKWRKDVKRALTIWGSNREKSNIASKNIKKMHTFDSEPKIISYQYSRRKYYCYHQNTK